MAASTSVSCFAFDALHDYAPDNDFLTFGHFDGSLSGDDAAHASRIAEEYGSAFANREGGSFFIVARALAEVAPGLAGAVLIDLMNAGVLEIAGLRAAS